MTTKQTFRDMFADLPVEQISESPQNDRSFDEALIENLKKNILDVGLKQPITVFEKEDGTYEIVDGARRFRALQRIGRKSIPCIIQNKPDNIVLEQIRSNVHRCSKEDIFNEVRLASDEWDKLDEKKKNYFTIRYRNEFDNRNAANPTYLANPDKYAKNYFRPRNIFINDVCGLQLSDKTIYNYLHGTNRVSDVESVPEPVKKEKKITKKNIIKQLESLDGMIDTFNIDCDDKNLVIDLEQFKVEIGIMIDKLGAK